MVPGVVNCPILGLLSVMYMENDNKATRAEAAITRRLTDWLAELVECQNSVQEVPLTPNRYSWSKNNSGESAAFVTIAAVMVRFSSVLR